MLKVINNKIVLTIGSTYTQYPNTKTPAELFGGTWAARHDNEGIFFRTPGGQATPFDGGIQAGGNKSHAHNRGNMEISGELVGTNDQDMNSRIFGIGTGAFYLTASGTHASSPGHWGARGRAGKAIFNASRAWSGVTSSEGLPEARPINRTYRIWECVGV